MSIENKIHAILNVNNAFKHEIRQIMTDSCTPLSESPYIVNLVGQGKDQALKARRKEKLDYRGLYSKYDLAYHNAIGLLDEPVFTIYEYESPVVWLSNLTPDEVNFYLFLALNQQETVNYDTTN
ncbi:hypothetical protein [Leuconostoc pseudomesenteroides]|uniref:hypothetical protein n=1 Tax=Leuconostoc pseudomesenteroides TaxID=33968 RepID=UPI0040358BF8